MLRVLYIILFSAILTETCMAAASDIYVIFYATKDGKTGHVGIAVDNYRVIYRDKLGKGGFESIPDTVATGDLTYYDLWPTEDSFDIRRTARDIPAVYYKLPISKGDEITLNSLYDKGIPHKEHYPCDGILRIRTNWAQDQGMLACLDSTMTANRDFNGQQFNCADFVRIPLEHLLGCSLESREFILVGWSTTPNMLYRNLRKISGIEVIKNADESASGSFIRERILYKILNQSHE